MTFDSTTYTSLSFILAAASVALLIIVAVALFLQKRREHTTLLRKRFGAEYDLALMESKARNKAEARLQARIDRVHHLRLRELTPAERSRYLIGWETIQASFIDRPRGAVVEADDLINQLMLSLGFPVEGPEQRAADLSVDHAQLVSDYRSANEIVKRVGFNEASTEEMRTAMLNFHAIFDHLLGAKTRIEQPAA